MNKIQPQLKNLGLFRVKKEDLYIELALRIKKAPVNRYDFSKLYFSPASWDVTVKSVPFAFDCKTSTRWSEYAY